MDNKTHGMACRLAQAVSAQGGTAYFVGGCVRDALMGGEGKDIDVEVHGLTPDALEAILDALGTRLQMGSSFGVYGLKGYDLDIAMPRQEVCTGRGHRDFRVTVDPFIGTEKAAVRRDFTVNAMMQNVLTGEIVDPFGGQEDLRRGVLRHVSDASFAEDALRVLRAAQFAARFAFDIAPETMAICRTIDLKDLPRERVCEEMRKALLKAERPSIFFEVLRAMGQLSRWFPELEALIGVAQSPKHHAEGDVWTHTMRVLDAAAGRRAQAKEPFGFMLAALVHDLGKAVCSEFVKGDIHAYGHEVKGLPLVEAFIARLTGEKALRHYVTNMTQMHMRPPMLAAARSTVKSTNRMFDESVVPEDLIHLAVCDDAGSLSASPKADHEPFLLERLRVYREMMARPYVMGVDLVDAGLAPCPAFSEILAYAHKLRLAGVEKQDALKQTLGYARQIRK